MLLCEIFGSYLSEDKNRYGYHHSGKGSAHILIASAEVDEEDGTHRCKGDVYDIVTYKYSGEKSVVSLLELKSELCSFVAFFGEGLESRFVE